MPKAANTDKLRLTPAFFHILLSVVNQAKHGYAIMQDAHDRSDGRIQLGPGSLYWAIKRLVDANLLEELAPPDDEEGTRRRYYGLTTLGRQRLKEEIKILADIVGYAEAQQLVRRSTVG